MIPGWLISVFTFPGIIIHEWAHKKFCEWLGVLVHQVKYFRFGNPAGYVLHEEPKTYKQTFWVSTGPLIINSTVAIFLGFLASIINSESIMWYFLLWTALSSGMHSFPSDHDMSHISKFTKSKIKDGGSIFYYLAFPFVWLIWIANKLKFFWWDLAYAIL